jgi:hypothetical protein
VWMGRSSAIFPSAKGIRTRCQARVHTKPNLAKVSLARKIATIALQWKEFDPHVEPLEVIEQEGGITDLKVRQLVKSLGGDVISDSEVWRVYTIANGFIERMDLKESETSSEPIPSAAFSRH